MTGALAVPGPASRFAGGVFSQAAAAAALLALCAMLPGTASAHASVPPPSLASDPLATTDAPEWHLLFGQAYLDTVTASTAAARIASVAALESDHWEMEPSGALAHLISQWKPVHHLIFRMFSGKAFGRVLIDVKPLSGRRAQIRFQGVLASHRDIEHNPARGWAEHAYASAVRVWQKEMHDDLARGVP